MDTGQDNIGYCVYNAPKIPESVIVACAQNFSNYYGVWKDPSRGRVTMDHKRLGEAYLFDESCGVCVAIDGSDTSNIVGHALFKRFVTKNKQSLWITQLVVKVHYRSRKIGQNLIYTALGTTTQLAAIASSHPHAVLALERAMFKTCCPNLIRECCVQTLQDSGVPYLQGRALCLDNGSCTVNTTSMLITLSLRLLRPIFQQVSGSWESYEMDGNSFAS